MELGGAEGDLDGTYLVAGIFYATLIGHSPVGVAVHSGISDADAAALSEHGRGDRGGAALTELLRPTCGAA